MSEYKQSTGLGRGATLSDYIEYLENQNKILLDAMETISKDANTPRDICRVALEAMLDCRG